MYSLEVSNLGIHHLWLGNLTTDRIIVLSTDKHAFSLDRVISNRLVLLLYHKFIFTSISASFLSWLA